MVYTEATGHFVVFFQGKPHLAIYNRPQVIAKLPWMSLLLCTGKRSAISPWEKPRFVALSDAAKSENALPASTNRPLRARNHRLRFSGLRDIRLRLRLARLGALRRLLVHPFVKPRTLKPPAIAQLERRDETVRSIFVKCIGTDAEVVRSHANVHDFANLIPRRCCSHRSSLLWELQDRARLHTRRCAYTAFSPYNTRNYRVLLESSGFYAVSSGFV